MNMENTNVARIGVIGAGWWSTYAHIPALLSDPRAKLMAIADSSSTRLGEVAAKYGVHRTYTDYRRMLELETLDGVVIAVPHALHYEIAKACIESDLHVMLEKPMTLHAVDSRELLDLADKHCRQIIVGFPYHFSERTIHARDIVRSGHLGKIELIVCTSSAMNIEFFRGNPEAYRSVFEYPMGGPVCSYADPKLTGGGQGQVHVSHLAGCMLFITELRAKQVSAFMEKCDVPLDLVDAIQIRMDNGAIGVVGSTGNIGVGDTGQFDVRVYCAQGYLLLDQARGSLYIRTHDGIEQDSGPLPPEDRYPRFATSRNLVDVICGQSENGSPGLIGHRTVELIEAAYLSAGRGCVVDVETLYGA
jgi:predicted dehydrogenase